MRGVFTGCGGGISEAGRCFVGKITGVYNGKFVSTYVLFAKYVLFANLIQSTPVPDTPPLRTFCQMPVININEMYCTSSGLHEYAECRSPEVQSTKC